MKYELSDLFLIFGGGTPKTQNADYWNGDIPWISVADMSSSFRYIETTEKTITDKGLKESSTKLLRPGDIIISARGTVGVINQVRIPMAFNQTCYGLRAKQDIVDQNYLYYLLLKQVPELQQLGHGAVFNTITRESFGLISVDLPPLETQKEIAHILGILDDKIELNRKMNKTLEEIAQTLYKHWFIDFEFPNEEGKPYKSSGGEMIDSELGLIPKGWRVGKAKDIISAIGGYAFKSENMCDNGDIGVIKIKNINNGVVNILDTEYLNDFDYNSLDIRFKVQAGDILIAMTGANVAKVGIVPITTKRLVLNQRVGIIRENTIGTIYYAYMIYKSDEAQQFLYSVGSTGSAQPNISSADIESLGIIIPSCEILALFSKVSINTYKMICKTLYQNEVLDNHKKLVMLEIFEARQYGN